MFDENRSFYESLNKPIFIGKQQLFENIGRSFIQNFWKRFAGKKMSRRLHSVNTYIVLKEMGAV